MAYTYRAWFPGVGTNVIAANVYMGNTYQTTIHSDNSGAGTSVKQYEATGVTTSMTLRDVSIASGWRFVRWVINIDGNVTYSTSSAVTVNYDASYQYVNVRIEVEEVVTYYATLNYNANGGSGAPSSQSGSTTNSDKYIQFNIPNTVPTRTGKVFQGWALDNSSATTPDRQPGGTITVGGSISGTTYTMYAVWADESSGTEAYIFNGSSWVKVEPYIFNGTSWVKYEPHVYDGGWS